MNWARGNAVETLRDADRCRRRVAARNTVREQIAVHHDHRGIRIDPVHCAQRRVPEHFVRVLTEP
jgi:hypothetical protein